MNDKLVIENREFYFHPTHKAYAGSIDGCVVHVVTREPTFVFRTTLQFQGCK